MLYLPRPILTIPKSSCIKRIQSVIPKWMMVVHVQVRLKPNHTISEPRRSPGPDPSQRPCRLPGQRAHPAVAVPPGAADGQVVPALHRVDGGRLGVQARRPG